MDWGELFLPYLDGPFSVRQIYRLRNLGEYAYCLDSLEICEIKEDQMFQLYEYDDPGLTEPIIG